MGASRILLNRAGSLVLDQGLGIGSRLTSGFGGQPFEEDLTRRINDAAHGSRVTWVSPAVEATVE